MTVRRLLVATSVAFGMLASVPASAGQAYSLDGRRTTTKSWKASLDESTVPTEAATSADPLTPQLSDCTAGSCDVHQLRLTLPKGTSWGRLNVQVTVPREMQTAVVLYDAKGAVVDSRDVVWGIEAQQSTDPPFTYSFDMTLNWLTKGVYTLAVHNRLGAGEVQAKVEWLAKRPDRKADRR